MVLPDALVLFSSASFSLLFLLLPLLLSLQLTLLHVHHHRCRVSILSHLNRDRGPSIYIPVTLDHSQPTQTEKPYQKQKKTDYLPYSLIFPIVPVEHLCSDFRVVEYRITQDLSPGPASRALSRDRNISRSSAAQHSITDQDPHPDNPVPFSLLPWSPNSPS